MENQRNKLLEQLYEQHYDSVLRLCLSVVKFNPRYYPLAEDCVQDAFVKASLNYEKYRDYQNPVGWIALVACNRFRSELKKEWRRSKVIFPLTQDKCENMAFSVDEIDSVLARKELAQQIVMIYNMLTEQEKIIFEAYFIGNKHVKDVITDTGLSMNSVRSGIKRIRKRARSVKNLNLIFILGCFFDRWHTM